ncbi:MAG: hypothetical protein JOZ77_08455 [Candidatus Eremiobacteraeota bacterium]|nr:hypothetical protein [Candidatus Eremiobacteraeota bacterium]
MTYFRQLTVVFCAVAAVFVLPWPADAAYCGSNADTSSLENLALSHGATDVSRIMDILVVQDYARVDIESKGRLTEYYVKDCGKWRFDGYTVPAEAPSSVSVRLSSFVPRDNGGTQCLNPSFVNHPSAP